MKTRRVPFDIEKAKKGARVVTRDGHKVDTIRIDGRDSYPISGWIIALQLIGDSDEYASFTEEGYYISSNNEDCRDLFIEEEEVDDDDYNPYKEVVRSISDMVERYTELQSLEELKDFYDNVKVKCREAVEYDKKELHKIEKAKTRKMTNQELSWWLRDCQQERREVCRVDEDTIYSRYIYRKCDANEEVPEYVRIRKNGGEWEEPLIEE